MAKAIRSATGYRLKGDRLILTGGPGLIARRPPPPDRRLAGDYRSCGNTMLGGYHEGPITLAIDARTIRDNAGCIADYRANGPNLDSAARRHSGLRRQGAPLQSPANRSPSAARSRLSPSPAPTPSPSPTPANSSSAPTAAI